jgi:glycosyltransferase involved in cell wall biosynthesis
MFQTRRHRSCVGSKPITSYRDGDGLAFRLAHQIPADARVLLNIGRIDPQKNQLESVEIFERIASSNSDIHLALAGPETDLGYAKTLKLRILSSSFADRIHLLGALQPGSQELIDAYQGSNIFLLTSVHEPFGLVLLEAWVAGLPVVAANVGGIPSFVEHGKNGLLFSSRNISEAVACIRRLLNDADTREWIRQNADLAVKQFVADPSLDFRSHDHEAVVHEHTLRA